MNSSLNKRIIGFAVLATGLLLLAGCHDDMWIQPKVHKPLRDSDFFVDGRSARMPVTGTLARGEYYPPQESAIHTGFEGKKLTDVFPFELKKADLLRGQELFNIYCSPCHGRLGYGDGMVAQRGFALRRKPGNYHTDRLRKMKVGHFYDVISNGFGAMFSYAARIQDPKDRWRVVGYIRVLQYSQNVKESDLPPDVDKEKMPTLPKEQSTPEIPVGVATPTQKAPTEAVGTPGAGR